MATDDTVPDSRDAGIDSDCELGQIVRLISRSGMIHHPDSPLSAIQAEYRNIE
jgi:hypothetical protein